MFFTELLDMLLVYSTSGIDCYDWPQKVQRNVIQTHPKNRPCQPIVYEIRVRGHLGCQWTDWFEGLSITLKDNGDTLFTGPVVDQAALHGLLRKVRDMGMPLLSVNRVSARQADAAQVKQQCKSR